MADLNELVLAYDELVVKNKKLIYEELFRPRIKKALMEPEKSMKNFGKNFVVEWTDPLLKDSSDAEFDEMIRSTMLECAQMLVDEGFMFYLDPENIKIKPTLGVHEFYSHDYFGKTDRTKLKPGFAHTPRVEKMVDIRLKFTRAEPLNTVKGAR